MKDERPAPLRTETPSSAHADLDSYPVERLVTALVDDQADAVRAVRAAVAQIAVAVEAAVPRLSRGGRLVYVGAGTSGRLGLLDSVELDPTFSWTPERSVALLAGGPQAIYRAIEGAEDLDDQGAKDVADAKTGPDDVLIALAASGTTPYTLGALREGRRRGALTIGIANNPGSPLAAEAECGITLDTGPELISGSTRLKAGTAQKVALNTISSAIMVRLNKVYGNLMVDLRATNAKLLMRAVRLTMLATGADEANSRAALMQCDFHIKTAIVVIAASVSADEARARLQRAQGSVRAALGRKET